MICLPWQRALFHWHVIWNSCLWLAEWYRKKTVVVNLLCCRWYKFFMPELSTNNHEGFWESIFLVVRVRLRVLTWRMRSALNTWLIKIVNTSRTCLLFSAYPLIAMWPWSLFSLIQLRCHVLQQVDNDLVGLLLGFWVENSKYHSTNFFSDYQLS